MTLRVNGYVYENRVFHSVFNIDTVNSRKWVQWDESGCLVDGNNQSNLFNPVGANNTISLSYSCLAYRNNVTTLVSSGAYLLVQAGVDITEVKV